MCPASQLRWLFARRRLLAAALAYCALGQVLAAAEHEFRAAIEQAQARTVKVYGAGIGREPAYATGIVVSPNGRILTALGVYLTGERIRVALPNGDLHFAQVERRSEAWQLALLKIEAATLAYFEAPAQCPVRAGDWIVAVSNAFRVADGSEPLSANLGVVSVRTRLDLKRGVQNVAYAGDVLVLDAITSNAGAPGGAVVSASGELAGMVGRLVEDKLTGTRLNYAVPADVLRQFIMGESGPEAIRLAKTEKAELGLRLFTLGGKKGPAFIDRVAANSPAAAAGLKPDDLILALAGKPVHDVREFEILAATISPGVAIEMVVKRGQETLKVNLTPTAAKELP